MWKEILKMSWKALYITPTRHWGMFIFQVWHQECSYQQVPPSRNNKKLLETTCHVRYGPVHSSYFIPCVRQAQVLMTGAEDTFSYLQCCPAKGNVWPLFSTDIYIKNRCFQLLVDSLAHCVQAVLWAPHCADGGLNHLKSTGLPVIGMHHAPNARHHSWTPLCAAAAAATTTAGRGVAGGGGLKRRWKREVGSQAQKRFDRWRGGGCWRNWSLCRGKDRGVNRRWRRWYCGWNRWWTCDWD